jgi:CubicO group peptidase (beta-lactamase class C family)
MSRVAAIDGDALRRWLEATDFSGIVHVVGDDGEGPLTIALGLSDRAGGLPNHPGTRFGVASTTKMLTGLTIARLVDRGVLRYEDRLAELIGEELRPRDLDPRVSLQHLLTHTSGVADYFDESGEARFEDLWDIVPATRIRRPRDLLPLLRDRPRVDEPDAVVRYNDGGYVLLGIAIEEVTGVSYPEAVRAEVLDPLGMNSSGFWALDAVVPDLAVGYLPPDPARRLGWRSNVYAIPAMGQPDGGAQCTAADLARALDGLVGHGDLGRAFLTTATRARVLARAVEDPTGPAAWGYGVKHVGEGASARIGHSGDDPGFSARAWAYPATGERVVVLSNVSDGASKAAERIDDLLAGLGR